MSADDEPVPRLPRTRGFKLSPPQLVRIGLTASLLALVLVVRRPCSDSVSKLVTGFGEDGSAAARMPRPGNVEAPSGLGSAGDYEQLRPGMTEAEIKAVIERSKARAAARARAAGDSGSAGSGSASGADGSAGSSGSAGSAGSGSAGSAGSGSAGSAGSSGSAGSAGSGSAGSDRGNVAAPSAR